MSIVAPPRHDDPELLVREARARQLRRRLGVAALIAVAAGAALSFYAITNRAHSSSSVAVGGGTRAAAPATGCGFRVTGTRVLGPDGSVAYRDPSKEAMWHELRCSGPTVWVVFVNGAGMMHEQYVGARSLDRGRTWRVAFAQNPGVRARNGIGAEPGPWAVVGPRAAYFVGACPACASDHGKTTGTFLLSVTKDGGRTFRAYPVPAPSGFGPLRVRVSGDAVTIVGRRLLRKVDKPPFEIYEPEVVRVLVA